MVSVGSKVLLSLSICPLQRYRSPRKTYIPGAGNQLVQGPGTQTLLLSWTSHCLQPRKKECWGGGPSGALRMTLLPFPFCQAGPYCPVSPEWDSGATHPLLEEAALGTCSPWDHTLCRTKSTDSGVSRPVREAEIWLFPSGLSNEAEKTVTGLLWHYEICVKSPAGNPTLCSIKDKMINITDMNKNIKLQGLQIIQVAQYT